MVIRNVLVVGNIIAIYMMAKCVNSISPPFFCCSRQIRGGGYIGRQRRQARLQRASVS
jgi:hypothetical protein